MSTVLMRMPVDDGQTDFIVVEVESRDVDSGVELAAEKGGRAVREAAASLDNSLNTVLPAITTLLRRLRSADDAPDEITVDLGLTVGGEIGRASCRERVSSVV